MTFFELHLDLKLRIQIVKNCNILICKRLRTAAAHRHAKKRMTKYVGFAT